MYWLEIEPGIYEWAVLVRRILNGTLQRCSTPCQNIFCTVLILLTVDSKFSWCNIYFKNISSILVAFIQSSMQMKFLTECIFRFMENDFKLHNISTENCHFYDEYESPVSTIWISTENGSRTIVHSNKWVAIFLLSRISFFLAYFFFIFVIFVV